MYNLIVGIKFAETTCKINITDTTVMIGGQESAREMEYNTKQKDILLKFFRDNPEECFTSREIIDDSRIDLGEATVYRLLAKLTEEGYLRKYIEDEKGKGARYQFYDKEECENHFHLKCVECGSLIHTECEEIRELEKHLSDEHGFTVDNSKTVIYGICEECRGNRHDKK